MFFISFCVCLGIVCCTEIQQYTLCKKNQICAHEPIEEYISYITHATTYLGKLHILWEKINSERDKNPICSSSE